MSKSQQQLEFDFDGALDRYLGAKAELQASMEWHSAPAQEEAEDEFEACIEIAAGIKRALRESGLSREQLVDGINAYFGRTVEGAGKEPPECKRPLSIHMLNNYLSKPADYPIPAYYLFAIHRVTRSLEPASVIVAAEGAKVASRGELKDMALGKVDRLMEEMRALRKEIKR